MEKMGTKEGPQQPGVTPIQYLKPLKTTEKKKQKETLAKKKWNNKHQ